MQGNVEQVLRNALFCYMLQPHLHSSILKCFITFCVHNTISNTLLFHLILSLAY